MGAADTLSTLAEVAMAVTGFAGLLTVFRFNDLKLEAFKNASRDFANNA